MKSLKAKSSIKNAINPTNIDSIKKAKHIISSIFANPAYAKLGRAFCTRYKLERLKTTLPPAMQENILYISYKPPKLLFCFGHPSFSNEFNRYRAKEIISCLKRYKDDFSEIYLEGLEVRGYVSKALLENKPSKMDLKSMLDNAERYCEHSKGEFINYASDKDLYDKIEQIRSLILNLQANK